MFYQRRTQKYKNKIFDHFSSNVISSQSTDSIFKHLLLYFPASSCLSLLILPFSRSAALLSLSNVHLLSCYRSVLFFSSSLSLSVCLLLPPSFFSFFKMRCKTVYNRHSITLLMKKIHFQCVYMILYNNA
jgi:hypothetical protein